MIHPGMSGQTPMMMAACYQTLVDIAVTRGMMAATAMGMQGTHL